MQFKPKALSISLLGTLVFSGSAFSEQPVSDAYAPGESHSKWIVGGALLAWDNPFINDGDDDDETVGTIDPRVEYRGERFFVDSDAIGITAFRMDGFSTGLVLGGDAGYLSDEEFYEDNDRLSGIQERDPTVNIGAYALHNYGDGQFKVTAWQEITDEHDGQSVEASYTYNFAMGRWNITPTAGVTWASDETVNHLYGVSERESLAANNIASYEGRSTTSAHGGVSARFDVTDNWDIKFDAGYVAYGDGITDSPLIEDSSTFVAGLGVNYNF